MPSVKNPNGLSKNRLAARKATARKQGQKRNQNKKSRVDKADATRGARDGLLPTSGPNRALGSKQKRKLERKLAYAMKRKMEAEGEVEMKDAADVPEEKSDQAAVDEQMAIDMENIS